MTLPAGCVLANIPNCPGLVKLTGLPTGSYYANIGFAIQEVADSFDPSSPEHIFVKANVDYANRQEQIGLFIGTCHPVDYTTGRVEPAHTRAGNAIAGTLAAPANDGRGNEMYKTVAEATAWWGSFPNPKNYSGGGGFSPYKP